MKKKNQNQNQNNTIRLQKAIADCGVCSRRKAEEYILDGKVTVNNELITEFGVKVDPTKDLIEVNGQLLDRESIEKIYLVLNKPRGYVTSLHDPEGRRTIMDLCGTISERIYPVGRLDYLSEGLLILTNDGELTNIITHPRYDVMKIYEVKVFGIVTQELLSKLRKGAQLREGFVKPRAVRVIKNLRGKTWLEFRLGEGKNREIRRLCEACGITVDKLKRVAIEELSIEGIATGKYRLMSKEMLLSSLGITEDGRKIPGRGEFQSSKKSIRLGGKTRSGVLASDSKYRRYRKDAYYDTIKAIKNKNIEEAARAKAIAKGQIVEEETNFNH